MRRWLLALLLLAACAASAGAAASAPRPFVAGSLAQILAQREGRPFILAFWSMTCVHCPAELKALAALQRRHRGLEVVLVATDSPAEGARAARLAREFGLAKSEQWIFADPVPERLRAEVERRWRGELPRTHFYDRTHAYEARTGLVDDAFIAGWLARNGVDGSIR